jgi:signal transduction histidine kinase
MDSRDSLRKRLDALFAGITEALPGTGSLAPDPLKNLEKQLPRGFVWEIDKDGQITWCSPEVEIILGYPAADLVDGSIDKFQFSPMDEIRSAINAGKELPNIRVTAAASDGSELDLVISGLRRSNTSGDIIGYRCVAQVAEEAGKRERMVMEIPLPPDEIGATSVPQLTPIWGPVNGYIMEDGEVIPMVTGFNPGSVEELFSSTKIMVPLQVQDQVIGVIELSEREDDRHWEEEDWKLAQSIAREFAVTLQDARSYHLTQQALDEMREADRLKTQFLANMSHELRTPLNSIIGFSRVILKGIDGPITNTQEEDLNAIYNAGQHLLGLINDILDVSKIEAGKMELSFTEVDLNDIIRGVMSTAVGLVKDKPIELVIDVPNNLPRIQGDNIRIRQVLLNLVSNAAKFTSEGQIGVSARSLQRGSRHEVVIAVFDTGPGIEPQDQKKIFEPFSQVDASPTRKTGGTGLGLSICRHLVELHGGQIWVESTPGQGSTFAFTIPYVPGDLD